MRYQTIVALSLPLAIILAAVPAHADDGGDQETVVNACGVERWYVKTGMDADAHLVNLRRATPTTIEALRQTAAPPEAEIPLKARVKPVETTIWLVQATLLRYKIEADSDYHLVIADPTTGHTMIAEIPTPQCVGSSPFKPAIAQVRVAFTARFHPRKTWQRLKLPITIAGVGFFDYKHGQSGVAPNAIELHPVMAITWSGGGSASVPTAPAGTPVSGALATPTVATSSGTLSVHVAVTPNPTSDGTATTVRAITSAGATCTVTIIYASGSKSGSKALASAQTAASSGQVSWTWKPSTRRPGPATATVQCSLRAQQASGTASFTIQ